MTKKPTYEELEQQIERLNIELVRVKSNVLEIQELSKIGNWEWDMEKQLLTWSDAIYYIFGLNPASFTPSPEAFESAIHPDDLNDFLKQREVMLSEKKQACIDHRIVLPDGSISYVQERTQLIINSRGEVCRVIGTVQDISERHQMEETLKNSEEKFRSIFNNSSDGILFTAPDGQIFSANMAACEALGWSEQELCEGGRSLITDTADSRLLQALEERKRTGCFNGELNYRRKNGVVFPVDISSNIFVMENGEVRSCIIFRDITNPKQAEADLRESEEKYRVIFNNEIYGICIFDYETLKFLDVNDSYTKLYGYSREELVSGMTIHDITVEHDESASATKKAVRDGRTIFIPLRYHRKKDGTIFPLETVGGPYTWKGHRVMFALARDISARKMAEAKQQELEAANKRLQKAESLGQMAGGIAHLFNNYLYAVTGNLELALEDLPEDSPVRENLVEAMNAARRSSDVSGSMLTYLGQSFAQTQSLDITEFCRKILSNSELQSSASSGITIETDLINEELLVRVNPNQMQQVLNHLITNACESIGENKNKGRITLVTKTIKASDIPKLYLFPVDCKPSVDTYVCVEVTDTGCGISKEDIHKLFDPFFTSKFTGRQQF